MQKLNESIIKETSLSTGIHPAYIEKDYYIVELLKIIRGFQSENFYVTFSGGTSLSKGFGIISRFSEDIDFMVLAQEEESRSVYRNFRKEFFDKIDETGILKVSPKERIIGNESRFVSFFVDYPKLFDDKSLRQQVKVEISAKAIRLKPENRKINSWINEYIGNNTSLSIDCLSMLETAANKFSAFLWRADCKDRTSSEKKYNDPTIVRHLYDLYKLATVISNNEQKFYKLILNIYEDDKNRGDKTNNLSLKEFASSTFEKICSDKYYEKEYSDFVNNMVYKDSDIIQYSLVLDYFKTIVQHITA